MTTSPSPTVTLAAGVRVALHRALEAAAGREPCGYVLGRRCPAGRLEVTAVTPGRNVHPEARRAWRLAPEEQLRVGRGARGRGLRVIGHWHGHLVGAPVPGHADRAGRSARGQALQLIVGRGPGLSTGVRAWLPARDEFVELAISGSTSPS